MIRESYSVVRIRAGSSRDCRPFSLQALFFQSLPRLVHLAGFSGPLHPQCNKRDVHIFQNLKQANLGKAFLCHASGVARRIADPTQASQQVLQLPA